MSEQRWLDRAPSGSVERRLLEAGKQLAAPTDLDASWLDFVKRAGPLALNLPGSVAPTNTQVPSPSIQAPPSVVAGTGAGAASVVPSAIKALVVGLALGGAGVAGTEVARRPHSASIASPSVALAPKAPRTPSPGLPQAAASADEVTSKALPSAPRSSARSTARESAAPRSLVPETAIVPRELDRASAADLPAAASFEPHVSAPSARRGDSPPSTDRENELHAEAVDLAAAEQLLRGGRALAARELLARGAQRFPNGALVQEREVLVMEAMLKTGEAKLAAQRAQGFLDRYPNTPFATRVRKILSSSE